MTRQLGQVIGAQWSDSRYFSRFYSKNINFHNRIGLAPPHVSSGRASEPASAWYDARPQSAASLPWQVDVPQQPWKLLMLLVLTFSATTCARPDALLPTPTEQVKSPSEAPNEVTNPLIAASLVSTNVHHKGLLPLREKHF